MQSLCPLRTITLPTITWVSSQFEISKKLVKSLMFFVDGPKLHVYTDKSEALKVMKQYKKGRYKTFKSKEDANDFAINGMEYIPSATPVAVVEEKSNNFKAPKPQNLTQFRKVIEKGDIEQVRTTIWSNPRFLVSCGDTPSILHVSH